MESAQLGGTVSMKLSYLAPREEYQHTKPYFINWPVDSASGVEQTNLSHKAYPGIQIHDIRGREESFDIDKNGFQLVNHHTRMTNGDFENDKVVRLKYYPELIDLVKTTLKASLVFPFEHTHRLHAPNVKGCGCSRKRKPLVSAHIDQTPSSAAQRVRYHMGDEAEKLLKGKYQVVNVWRPLFGPLWDHPLALGDAQTFDIERDGVPTDLVFPHYVGESFNLLYNSSHTWYYVSGQQRDEVYMFKCADTEQGVAKAAPHCSFDIQKGAQIHRPRESIEVRMLVFYD